MSQSPWDREGSEDVYTSAWKAVNKLMRRGFSWSGHERNCAFLNLGDGSFARVDATSGFGYYDDGRAATRIDWDLDGDLDLFITNRNGPRLRFLRNDLGASANFVALKLRGTKCNGDAIGARILVHGAGGQSLTRSVRAGEGYLAQQSLWIHFGLGALNGELDRVEVRWPGGEVETFSGIASGNRYELVQGRGVAERWDPPARESRLAESPVEPPPATQVARVVLPNPVIMPRLVFEGPEEGQLTATWGYRPGRRSTPTGRPILLTLWASWCAPCRVELTDLRERADDLATADLAVVALGVEQGEDRLAARQMLEDVAWPYPAIFASPETLDILNALQGMLMDRDTPLPIPTSFLLDPQGSLLAMYFGPVDVDQVLSDVNLGKASPDERLAAASPFTGEWGQAPEPLELATLAARFGERGLLSTEREIRFSDTEVRERTRAGMLYEFGREAGMQGRWQAAAGYFREALTEDPAMVEAWGDLGIALHRQGMQLEEEDPNRQLRMREAVDAYRQALLRDPDLPIVRANLGIAYVHLGDRSSAEEQLRYLEREGHTAAAEGLAAELATLPGDDD